ncbi:unnamed protein product [Gadus morhua 'NCC']
MPRKERRLKQKELREAAKGSGSLTSWMTKSTKVQAVSLGCSLSQQVVSSKLSAVWQCLHYEINTAHLQQYQQQQPPHQPPQQKLFNVPMRYTQCEHCYEHS